MKDRRVIRSHQVKKTCKANENTFNATWKRRINNFYMETKPKK